MAPECFDRLHLPFVANRQLLAPSGPPPGKNLAAGLCRHAGTETVRVLPLPNMRLIRPLHVLPSLLSTFLETNKACQDNNNSSDLQS